MSRITDRRLTLRAALPLAAALCALAFGALVVYAADVRKSAQSQKRRAVTAYTVIGTIDGALSPGSTRQVLLRIRNTQRFPISIRSLRFTMTIDPLHAAQGCSVKRDFTLLQLPKSSFPIKLAANNTPKAAKKGWQTLSAKQAGNKPAIMMHNLTQTNQDACKGAIVRLKFSGRAVKAKTRARSTKKK